MRNFCTTRSQRLTRAPGVASWDAALNQRQSRIMRSRHESKNAHG